MTKKLLFLLVALPILFFGCKGDDGKEGDINIKLSGPDSPYQNTYELACLVLSGSKTACICSADGTIYVDGDSLHAFCDLEDSSVTLVESGTEFTGLEAGSHYYCFTNDTSTSCGDGMSGNLDLYGGNGKSGTEGLFGGEDGDKGDTINWAVFIGSAGVTTDTY